MPSREKRFVCIHGHFYQPPRENPWLEAVELQDSARPYHDWNERITAECYGANAASRILAADGAIAEIVNNYARISFDMGPTLLSWLERRAPDVYAAVLAADRESAERFSGHGSAMAQPYNHMIMPLANARDKATQARWGLRDFEARFGRKPEGMWLPEAAVDTATLEVLAAHGIRFTVLAPHQAERVRPLGPERPAPGGPKHHRAVAAAEPEWADVHGAGVDPGVPYRVRLPSGRSIAVFFYDGPVARAVAFEGLLSDGAGFAGRLAGLHRETPERPRLAHIATDGESYGHHHRHGDMALAFALRHIEERGLGRLTNYAEFLAKHAPAHEAQVAERTSWSCSHGVERWRSACGCSSGSRPGWSQEWRKPLRDALDWLRDELARLYEGKGSAHFRDPWEARDAYIDVVLDRSPKSLDRFFAAHSPGGRPTDRIAALKLLELQRNAMLMFTSCGWFFDELSGIETVQVLQYAGRALQLAVDTGARLEEPFLERLAAAPSNIPEHGDGRRVYERFVKPARVDLLRAAAHFAVESLFEDGGRPADGGSFRVRREAHEVSRAGKARLAVGRARVESAVTLESARVAYAVLHLGDHNIHAGVRAGLDDAAYAGLRAELARHFGRADLPAALSAIDRGLGPETYSLRSMFRDAQRRVLDSILRSTVDGVESVYCRLQAEHAPLMRYLGDLGVPPPRALRVAAEFVLNAELRRLLTAEGPEPDRVRALLAESATEGIPLASDELAYAFGRRLEALSREWVRSPLEPALLRPLAAAATLAADLPFRVDLWRPQNDHYAAMTRLAPQARARAESGDEEARAWLDAMQGLGRALGVRVAAPKPQAAAT